MTRMTSDEAQNKTASFITKGVKKKPRINWKKEIKKQKLELCQDIIEKLNNEIRGLPSTWHRGYYSAITQIEHIKDAL